MKKEEVIKFFDLVLLSEKDDSFFGIHRTLVPEYISKDDLNISELRREIKRFSEFHGYFKFFQNGQCKLTKHGLKAKSKGGHLKLLKYNENKENKEDELLDLEITLKRFESKIGRKLKYYTISISFLSFIITVLTLEFWQTDESRNEQKSKVEKPLLNKKEEIQKDSLN